MLEKFHYNKIKYIDKLNMFRLLVLKSIVINSNSHPE